MSQIPKNQFIWSNIDLLSHVQQAEIQKQVDMLQNDIIEQSDSLWNFPLLVVTKNEDEDGNRIWRVCVDFRKLNENSQWLNRYQI